MRSLSTSIVNQRHYSLRHSRRPLASTGPLFCGSLQEYPGVCCLSTPPAYLCSPSGPEPRAHLQPPRTPITLRTHHPFSGGRRGIVNATFPSRKAHDSALLRAFSPPHHVTPGASFPIARRFVRRHVTSPAARIARASRAHRKCLAPSTRVTHQTTTGPRLRAAIPFQPMRPVGIEPTT